MAFVNERLTTKQRDEFESKRVKNPTINSALTFLRPLFWTIDRENDACLIHAGVYRDEPDENYFVFFWKGQEHHISLVYYGNGNTATWKKENRLSPYVFSTSDEFVPDLRKALGCFAFDGYDNQGVDVVGFCDF